jgi:hypothetical protein
MTIKLIKRKGSVTVSITSRRQGQEGVDLKDAVLGGVGDGKVVTADVVDRIVKRLAERGYRGKLVKETRMSRTFQLTKGDS